MGAPASSQFPLPREGDGRHPQLSARSGVGTPTQHKPRPFWGIDPALSAEPHPPGGAPPTRDTNPRPLAEPTRS